MTVYGAAFQKGIISLEALCEVLTQPMLKLLRKLASNPVHISADWWQRVRSGQFKGRQSLWAILATGFQASLDQILNSVLSLDNREKVVSKLRKDGFLRVRATLGVC